MSPFDVKKKTIVWQVWRKGIIYDDGIGEIQIPLWQVDMDTEVTVDLSPYDKPVLNLLRPAEDES